jgi:hypothetical protein
MGRRSSQKFIAVKPGFLTLFGLTRPKTVKITLPNLKQPGLVRPGWFK